MTTTLNCGDEIEVRPTERDVWITRLALDELMVMSTPEEHVYRDFSADKVKLPEAHEPECADYHCEAEKADA